MTLQRLLKISKLRKYGVRGVDLKLFESFLDDRKQFIAYSNNNTSFEKITCGVPQGSVLGHLLLLIYINDLSQASNKLESIIFADDTNPSYSHHQIKILF